MIEVEKIKGFQSCNGCGRYNQQPTWTGLNNFKLCGEVYTYTINHCIEVRLCNDCAKDFKRLLNNQVKGEKDETHND